MNKDDAIYVKSSRVRNTLPGTEGTYHDSVSSIDLCDLDTFAERVGKICGYGAAVVKNVIAADGAEAQEILSTRLYRISDVFGLTLEAAISGSVPSLDSPLTEDNKVYVAVYPSAELKNAPGGITPVRSGDYTEVVLDRVEDEASGKPGIIDGTKTFLMTGWGLSTSFDGEGVSVKSLVDGTEATATVSRNENGQSVWASLGSALPAGKAKVCVTTRGGDAAGELWPVYKSVTVVAGEPPAPVGEPTITSAKSGDNPSGTISPGETLYVEGTNLETATEVELLDQQEDTIATVSVTYADSKLSGAVPQMDLPSAGYVKVTTAGGSAQEYVDYFMP